MRSRCRVAGAAAAVLAVGTATVEAANLNLTSQHLTSLATCALVSYPAAAPIAADSFVAQASPTMTAGSATTISVASWSGANVRAYVRFDLTQCLVSLPASGIVRAATLRLFVTAMSSACRTLDVFAAPSSWTESTVDWQNQPVGTATNNPPSAQRTSFAQVGSSASCANKTVNQYVAWDVTADLGKFVAGTATNSGWLIRDDIEDSSTFKTEVFTSQDAGTLSQAPQLIVSYTLT
jgi:hypothetical protein